MQRNSRLKCSVKIEALGNIENRRATLNPNQIPAQVPSCKFWEILKKTF